MSVLLAAFRCLRRRCWTSQFTRSASRPPYRRPAGPRGLGDPHLAHLLERGVELRRGRAPRQGSASAPPPPPSEKLRVPPLPLPAARRRRAGAAPPGMRLDAVAAQVSRSPCARSWPGSFAPDHFRFNFARAHLSLRPTVTPPRRRAERLSFPADQAWRTRRPPPRCSHGDRLDHELPAAHPASRPTRRRRAGRVRAAHAVVYARRSLTGPSAGGGLCPAAPAGRLSVLLLLGCPGRRHHHLTNLLDQAAHPLGGKGVREGKWLLRGRSSWAWLGRPPRARGCRGPAGAGQRRRPPAPAASPPAEDRRVGPAGADADRPGQRLASASLRVWRRPRHHQLSGFLAADRPGSLGGLLFA